MEASAYCSRFVNLNKITLFAMGGGLGFAVNFIVLGALLPFCGAFLGQSIAFVCASAITWLINSRYVFPARQGKHGRAQMGRYAISSLVNAFMINALYSIGIWLGIAALMCLLCAAMISAMTNFLLLDRWVFAQRSKVC